MATKGKKDFASNLKLGRQRDQELRAAPASVDERFDQVDAALAGRSSLLAPAANEGAKAPDASFYVETLVKEGRATRRVASLELTKISDNPLNSRRFYDEEKVTARAKSMAADGQLVPAVAAPNPTKAGHYILIDGHYRKRGALRNSWTHLDCLVLEGLSEVDFYKLARTLNNEREQETILDVAFSYRQLLDSGIARTEEALIPIVGENKSKINKVLALTELPQSVIDIMVQTPENFGISIGYELTLFHKAAGEERTAQLAKRIVDEDLSFSKVEAVRKKAEQGTKAKRHTSRQYKLIHDGAELGTLKEWDTGRISLDLTLEDPAKREKLLASLKRELDLDEPT